MKSLKKKFKDKRFAAGVSRDVIRSGAEMLGWELDELFARTIEAMQSFAPDKDTFQPARGNPLQIPNANGGSVVCDGARGLKGLGRAWRGDRGGRSLVEMAVERSVALPFLRFFELAAHGAFLAADQKVGCQRHDGD